MHVDITSYYLNCTCRLCQRVYIMEKQCQPFYRVGGWSWRAPLWGSSPLPLPPSSLHDTQRLCSTHASHHRMAKKERTLLVAQQPREKTSTALQQQERRATANSSAWEIHTQQVAVVVEQYVMRMHAQRQLRHVTRYARWWAPLCMLMLDERPRCATNYATTTATLCITPPSLCLYILEAQQNYIITSIKKLYIAARSSSWWWWCASFFTAAVSRRRCCRGWWKNSDKEDFCQCWRFGGKTHHEAEEVA